MFFQCEFYPKMLKIQKTCHKTFLTTKLKKKKTLIQRICSSPHSTFVCTFLLSLLANSSTITCHLASPNVRMLPVPFGIFLLKFNEKEDKIDVCTPNVHEFLAQKLYFTLNNFRKVTLQKGMSHLVAPKQVFI